MNGTCSNCAVGTVSLLKALECNGCSVGAYVVNGECKSCDNGYYNILENQTECMPCLGNQASYLNFTACLEYETDIDCTNCGF